MSEPRTELKHVIAKTWMKRLAYAPYSSIEQLKSWSSDINGS